MTQMMPETPSTDSPTNPPNISPNSGTGLDVTSPDGSRSFVRVTESPFLLGRGADSGNHLQLEDRRISRRCAAIVRDGDQYILEDRGHRQGLFVNGNQT